MGRFDMVRNRMELFWGVQKTTGTEVALGSYCSLLSMLAPSWKAKSETWHSEEEFNHEEPNTKVILLPFNVKTDFVVTAKDSDVLVLLVWARCVLKGAQPLGWFLEGSIERNPLKTFLREHVPPATPDQHAIVSYWYMWRGWNPTKNKTSYLKSSNKPPPPNMPSLRIKSPLKIISANNPPFEQAPIWGKHNCKITSYFKKAPKNNSCTVLLPLTGY